MSTNTYASSVERSNLLATDIASDPSRYRTLTGERPTGPLHLGHLFGTIRERVRLQELGVETMIVLADYQVITDRDAIGHVRQHVYDAALDNMAAGIDPEKSTIFAHSAVPALNQLVLPFLSLVTEAELHRNPTVKAELAASGRALSGLLLTYPVHQAADILFCKANVVPVGKDQLPHIEMSRVIARRQRPIRCGIHRTTSLTDVESRRSGTRRAQDVQEFRQRDHIVDDTGRDSPGSTPHGHRPGAVHLV